MSFANEAIIFKLNDENGTDYLIAALSKVSDFKDMSINLNDSATCQNELRSLFAKLVEIIIGKDITVTFERDENYPRELIQSAMESYATDLNSEIKTTRQQIVKELNEE